MTDFFSNVLDAVSWKKNVPDIIDCNLKSESQIVTLFGMNNLDTTGHQTIVQVPTSPKVFPVYCLMVLHLTITSRHQSV